MIGVPRAWGFAKASTGRVEVRKGLEIYRSARHRVGRPAGLGASMLPPDGLSAFKTGLWPDDCHQSARSSVFSSSALSEHVSVVFTNSYPSPKP